MKKSQSIKVSSHSRKTVPSHEEFDRSMREALIEEVVTKTDAKALRVAKSTGVKLLSLAKIDKSIVELTDENGVAQAGISDRVFEARVTAEYHVGGFSQTKLDFKIIRESGNVVHLIKNGFTRLWYQIKTEIALNRSNKDVRPLNATLSKRALVAGHFSIPGGGGTFGDIEALGVVCEWLSQAQIEFDVASNQEDGVDGLTLDSVDERDYNIFVFVCGPWYHDKKITALLLERFRHCYKIGVNLTIFDEGNAGFDYLLSRDDLSESRVDIAFVGKVELKPVVGVILTLRQSVYGRKQQHLYVKQVIEEYLAKNEVVPIWLDTIAYKNKAGLKSSSEFESLVRKVDVIITNRLHGLVLGLKNSVPVVAIDAISGGGKVTAQARALGWPILIYPDELDVEKLRESVQTCLSNNLDEELKKSGEQALNSVESTKKQFMKIIAKID